MGRKVELHSANIRAIYEQKVAELEAETKQSKEQLRTGFAEKKSLLDQFERMESEKLSLEQQLSKAEKDLQSARKEIEKVVIEKEEINNQKQCVDESLCALKECKRVVEIRYKNILTDMSEQTNKLSTLAQQNIHLQASNKSLQDQIYSLEHEKHEQTEILAELQQNLVFKSSEYENQIRNMQVELGNLLDEINGVKREDVNKVKSHYMDLFQEKASEVMILREEAERLNKIIDEYKSKVKDLEFR